ncbi:MAG TPA: hypothetical protein VM096_02375 [Vicinamibacterales bacterium]|nr:hypothetical protein [Vicinamibacterales bacterium]
MKFFRVGSCLALLIAGVSCSQTPQNVTAPTAVVGGATAETAAADGTTLKVTAPALISPVDGVRAEDRRPTLIYLNSTGRYAGIGVAYDIQLSTPTAVIYERTVGESPDIGAHLIDFDLDFDVLYSWRVRAHLGNPDSYGPWSPWATFRSPNRAVAVVPVGNATLTGGCAAPLSPMGPGETRKPRPNDSAIVRAVASAFPVALARSCQPEGGSWEFMDRAVDALRAHDGRYGYNCKRGNCGDPSLDVVSYYYGVDPNGFQGADKVYIFDLIAGHCGATPSVIWNDVTDITFSSGTVGKTTYPRPGRVVAPCTP